MRLHLRSLGEVLGLCREAVVGLFHQAD